MKREGKRDWGNKVLKEKTMRTNERKKTSNQGPGPELKNMVQFVVRSRFKTCPKLEPLSPSRLSVCHKPEPLSTDSL